LKDEAEATGKSLSELVRACVASHLVEREKDPLFDMVGYVRREEDKAPADLAERHDAYLYGAKR
jgi:hypothetical protein